MIILHTNFGDIRIELNSSKAPISSKTLRPTQKVAFIMALYFIVLLKTL